MVKGWVVELKELLKVTQTANQASMLQIQSIVENSTTGLESMITTMTIRESAAGALVSGASQGRFGNMQVPVVDQ